MKYYTPELEEFHIGFEYEILEDWDTYTECTWWPQVYGRDGSNPEGLGFVDKNTLVDIRVKYLDEQDIKELGWGFIEQTVPDFEDQQDYVEFIYKGTENWYLSHWINLGIVKLYECPYENCQYVEGMNIELKIKNKSELQKLMKQIGI